MKSVAHNELYNAMQGAGLYRLRCKSHEPFVGMYSLSLSTGTLILKTSNSYIGSRSIPEYEKEESRKNIF